MEAISHIHVFFPNKISPQINKSNSFFLSHMLYDLNAPLLQFIYVVPLPLITGEIPERIICSNLVFFCVSTNSLYNCTILIVPSLSALFGPICTNIDPTWPCPNTLSTRSVTCSILAPGSKQRLLLCLMSCLSFAKWSLP